MPLTPVGVLEPIYRTALDPNATFGRFLSRVIMGVLIDIVCQPARGYERRTVLLLRVHFLQALRAETEALLAGEFDQKAFHDFMLAQGMLPPKLMKDAVM